MLASTEMREHVTCTNNSTIKLVPANTVVSINRDDIETEVIQAIKSGNIDFLKITLESGHEQKILQVEKETHHANLQLNLCWLEYQLLSGQKDIINEYIDKISNGEDVALSKTILRDRLTELSDSIVDQAIKHNNEAVDIIKKKLKVLNIQPTDVYTLRAYYYNYMKMHEIKFPIHSVSLNLEKIRSNLSKCREANISLTKKHHDFLDQMSGLHRAYDKFLEEQKSHFIQILSGDRENIPLRFNFNHSDKNRINDFLAIKINPNVVESLTGDTLLNIAIDHDREDIVKLLLERSADIFIKNKAGISANDKASLLPNSKYLRIFSLHLDKIVLSNIDYAYLSKEIKDILDPMLTDANVILQKYGIKLSDRKSMSLFLKVLFRYSARLESRSHDLAAYMEKLSIASRDGDPSVFFNEVIKRAFNAERGMLNQSSLHDPLQALMQKFIQVFDAHVFNELKKNKTVTELPFSSSEDTMRSLKSKLDISNNENTILRVKLKQYENQRDIPEEQNSHSARQTLF